MVSLASDLKKTGKLKLPNGGQLTKLGKAVMYEAMQELRVSIPMDAVETLEDRPMIVFMESLTGIRYADFVKKLADLTPREIQVFDAIGTATKNQVIAETFGISPKTLDIHRANIMRKLGVRGMNPLTRAFWMYRICNECYPDILKTARLAHS